MTKLNPPMGFTSRDWSKEIGAGPDEVVLNEEQRFRGPIPIPASMDGGKTLDWSRSVESESWAHASVCLNPIVHCE